RNRLAPVQRQYVTEEVLRGREVAQLFQEDRHVEMDPPLGAVVLCERLERLGQVQIPGDPAVLARDHLMQIDRLVERPKLLRRFGPDAGHGQRGAELQLRYADARRAQRLNAARRILEFDRGVTHVVADAEVAAQRVLGGAGRQAGELAQLAYPIGAEQVPLEEA